MKQTFLGVTVHVHHKGGNSQQEMQTANQVSAQQLATQNKMLNDMFAEIGITNPQIKDIINNGGLDAKTEAAMRSSAMAQTGQQAQQAIGAINQNLVARGITGGTNAGSGDIARNYGALEQGLLGQQAQNLQGIQQFKAQNLNTALGMGLQTASLFGGQGLGAGQQGVGALGIGQQAANAADQASTGFWGSLVGGLAGLGSAGIGKIPCWAARAVYGENDWRPVYIWARWNLAAGNSWFYRLLMALYLVAGEPLAFAIRRVPRMKRLFRSIFDKVIYG